MIIPGHRFDIFKDVGCFPPIVSTSLTYLLITLWPVFIGIVSIVFTIMNLVYIPPHRHVPNFWIEWTPSSILTSSLFARLVFLGLIAFGLSCMVAIRNLILLVSAGSVT